MDKKKRKNKGDTIKGDTIFVLMTDCMSFYILFFLC